MEVADAEQIEMTAIIRRRVNSGLCMIETLGRDRSVSIIRVASTA
jgi:hypothetical protein